MEIERIGSPDGYSTAMVRTTEGEEIYNGARQAGFIQEIQFENKEELIIHRTSLKAKIVAFTQRKTDGAARHLVSGEHKGPVVLVPSTWSDTDASVML